MNPEETIKCFGFSRRKFYEFLKDGKKKNFLALYGNRKVIIRIQLEQYLEENPKVKEGLLNAGKIPKKT